MVRPPLSSAHRFAVETREGEADVVVAGAGLAGALIALRLKVRRPELRVVALDARSQEVEDAHTWSYFATDVTAATRAWLDRLAEHRWSGYGVRFPSYRREIATPYASLTGRGLQGALAEALGPDLRLGSPVLRVSASEAALPGDRVWRASLVIDARGPRRSDRLSLAWQKFVGVELKLRAPHGLTRPTVMDATVAQLDGFRFVYLLPFAEDRLLVEDTYYSAGPGLDDAALEARALAYAAAVGWQVEAVIRRERGVLPIVLGGDLEAYLAEADSDAPAVGLRAPLFHPVTGYSLPEAAALADEIAAMNELTSAAVADLVLARVRRRWREGAYLRALNRMMFLAAEPQRRYRVLERFYRLPQPLIERFYAGRLSLADQARILCGAPPVPVGAALRALPERAALSPARPGAASAFPRRSG